jgi:hypothetical protein
MRFRLSTLLYWIVAGSILARLLLSSWLLDSWYPYSAAGGELYYKIHPGTVIAVSGFTLLVVVKGVPKILGDLWTRQRPALIYLTSVLAVSLTSIMFHGVSGTAYLVDTFLAAGIYPVILWYVEAERALRIAAMAFAVVGINAGVAIGEYVGGFHLLPQPFNYGFFRASALFGHPLTNALLTTTCMFAALVMPWRAQVKVGYLTLLMLSLFAFAARGALFVSAAAIMIAILAFPYYTRTGRRNQLLMLPLAMIGVAIVSIVLLGVLFGTEFGDAIASRMASDASTEARFASLQVVRQFSTHELLLGSDSESLAYQLDLAGVPIVENFWAAMLLSLGIPLLLIMVIATALLLTPYLRRTSFYLQLQLLVFIAVASTNNSLSAKNCSLVLLVVLLAILGVHQTRQAKQAAQ